jgi:hypothetical protein
MISINLAKPYDFNVFKTCTSAVSPGSAPTINNG